MKLPTCTVSMLQTACPRCGRPFLSVTVDREAPAVAHCGCQPYQVPQAPERTITATWSGQTLVGWRRALDRMAQRWDDWSDDLATVRGCEMSPTAAFRLCAAEVQFLLADVSPIA